jgi:hypothetical protein
MSDKAPKKLYDLNKDELEQAIKDLDELIANTSTANKKNFLEGIKKVYVERLGEILEISNALSRLSVAFDATDINEISQLFRSCGNSRTADSRRTGMKVFTAESKVSDHYSHVAIEETEPDEFGNYLELAWENGYYKDPERFLFVVRYLEKREPLPYDDHDGKKYYNFHTPELFDNLKDAFRAFLIRKSQGSFYEASGVPTIRPREYKNETPWKVGDKAWINTNNPSGAYASLRQDGHIVIGVVLKAHQTIWHDPGFVIKAHIFPDERTIRAKYLYRTPEEAMIGESQ